MRIRPATPEDANRLAEIGARTFAATFGNLYPAEDLAAFLAESHSPQSYARLLGDPRQAAWLLEDGAGVRGYATAGPCGLPHPDVAPGDGELKRLYLDPEAQGSGHGSRLLGLALDWLQRDGPCTLWISVFSENPGAQRLYARHGFGKAGEYAFPVGRVRDREFIFRRTATS